MVNLWFTADSHYNHANIVRGISKWKGDRFSATRDFKTLQEHNNAIVDGINKYVKENDVLFHIGDWSFGGPESIKIFRNRIKCKTIHLCLGNHDDYIRENYVFQDGTTAYQLFSSVNDIIQKKINKNYFVMCHYAFRTYRSGSKGAINLHGHSHGSLAPYQKLLQIADDPYLYKTGDLYKQLDVGVDVAYELFREYRPFHIGEVLNIMENRVNLGVDHH